MNYDIHNLINMINLNIVLQKIYGVSSQLLIIFVNKSKNILLYALIKLKSTHINQIEGPH